MPGRRGELVGAFGKARAGPCGDGAGAGDQIAGARVVAEPRPGGHDVVVLGGREIANARPARDEALEIGRDGLHRRLLQHDLRKPHAIGIGADAEAPLLRADAPGKTARMAVVPGEQARRTRGAIACAERPIGLCGRGRFASLAGIAPVWLSGARLARARGASSTVPYPSRPAAKPVAELIGGRSTRSRGSAAWRAPSCLSWWPDIVGAAYAGRTAPERIRWPRDGKAATLVVRCDPSLSLQFAHETDRVRERLNSYFGYPAVGAVRIVQQADRARRETPSPSPAPSGRSRRDRKPARSRRGAAQGLASRARPSVLARS